MRLRWFTLRPFGKPQFDRLAEGMLEYKYGEESGCGFVVGDVRPSKLTGRFVRRETVTRLITNPQGESETVQFTDFTSTQFAISTSSPQMELRNHARRLSEFITALGDLLNNRVAVIPIEANCRDWLAALGKAGCSVRLTKLVTGSVAVSEAVVVKASFCGSKNVLREAAAFFQGRKFAPETVAGEVEIEGDLARFRIGSNGSFAFLSEPSEALVAAVRKSVEHIEQGAYLEGNFERRIHGGLPRAETERHADLQVVRDTDTAQGNLGAHAREASLRPQRRAKVRHTLDGLS